MWYFYPHLFSAKTLGDTAQVGLKEEDASAEYSSLEFNEDTGDYELTMKVLINPRPKPLQSVAEATANLSDVLNKSSLFPKLVKEVVNEELTAQGVTSVGATDVKIQSPEGKNQGKEYVPKGWGLDQFQNGPLRKARLIKD